MIKDGLQTIMFMKLQINLQFAIHSYKIGQIVEPCTGILSIGHQMILLYEKNKTKHIQM